jgi:hypothetical protein
MKTQTSTNNTYYLSGPMRGYPRFNFDAFDAAALDLRGRGWSVRSPADMDREVGFDPDQHTEESLDWNDVVRRDVEAVIQAEGIILLPGWEKSKGATAEIAVARWMEKTVLLYPSLRPMDAEDILEEALRITSGDRQASYGPPDQDFKRTARMWEPLLESCVQPDGSMRIPSSMVAMCMIALKLSRETHQKKRDNSVDIAGYARCLSLCQTATLAA